MSQILTSLFLIVFGVLCYQAITFLVRAIQTRERNAIWCFVFVLASATYTLMYVPLYTWEPGKSTTFAPWHFLIGYAMFATYLKCLKNYFMPASRSLGLLILAVSAVGLFFGALMLYEFASGSSILFAEHSVSIDSLFLPVAFAENFAIAPIAAYTHTVVRLLVLAGLLLLVFRGNLQRDRPLQVGILVSTFVLAHNFVSVHWLLFAYLPLLPFMTLIESSRFDWISHRGLALALEQLHERERHIKQAIDRHQRLSQLGRDAAAIIHDLANPAQIISGQVDGLRKIANEIGDERLFADTEAIENANERVVELLRAHRERYLEQGDKEAIPLASVVADALSLTRARAESQGIKLTVTGESSGHVYIDRVSVSQAFVNLITNAVEAVDGVEDAWVRIETQDDGDFVRAAVINNGPKIPAEIAGDIFEPFFTTRAGLGGSGIGLAICRTNIGKSDGSLELNIEGEFTQFDIAFPRHPRKPEMRLVI